MCVCACVLISSSPGEGLPEWWEKLFGPGDSGVRVRRGEESAAHLLWNVSVYKAEPCPSATGPGARTRRKRMRKTDCVYTCLAHMREIEWQTQREGESERERVIDRERKRTRTWKFLLGRPWTKFTEWIDEMNSLLTCIIELKQLFSLLINRKTDYFF